ncbi:cytochrome P450 family protein [Tieghemostelium lacteum]|uniref:Cytochrome P450 family protein n=1 Tax=Tieghemostelium lacteum TaxID=361077 RepID=A0A151ZIL0_TIELA|nr:cytochrome P450 family protein [Tieghemostelium lacteum]|eukprot:KYQ93720.1 cytochrome P450 family protein [Tieghemostelium lacteum]
MFLFTILLILLSIVIYQKVFRGSVRYPNGPINLPIIGGLYLLDKKLLHESIHGLYKKYGRVFGINFGHVYTVFLSEHEVIHQAFTTHAFAFTNRYILPSMKIVGNNKNIGMVNGQYWKTVRAIATTSLTKSKTRRQEYNINEQYFKFEVALIELIKNNNGLVNIRPFLKHLSFNIIFNFVFSQYVPYNSEEIPESVKLFLKDSNDLLHALAAGSPGDYIKVMEYFDDMAEIRKITSNIVNFAKPHIQQHLDTIDIENPRDFIDLLIIEIQKDEGKQIGIDAIGHICIDLLVGGTDTSSTTIEWIILFLCNYPEIQEKLLDELNQIPGHPSCNDKNSYPFYQAILKETWRISPPVPFYLPHQCTENVEIDGKYIPAGAQIFANVYSAGRNENLFPNPTVFNPLRFINSTNNVYPFSMGPRKCPGQSLAEDELFLIATKLFKNFKFERPTDNMFSEEGITSVTYDPVEYKFKVEKRI